MLNSLDKNESINSLKSYKLYSGCVNYFSVTGTFHYRIYTIILDMKIALVVHIKENGMRIEILNHYQNSNSFKTRLNYGIIFPA